MAKIFEYGMSKLAEESGYSYDTLIDIWDECLEETGELPDWDYFSQVSMEHDW